MAESFEQLASELARLFSRGVEQRWGEGTFDRWAVRVFRWQFEHNAAFRGYCTRRHATPESVRRWEQVPPVPTTAFQRLRLLSLEERQEPEVVFRTSGTTRGSGQRGEHPVASLALYRASLLPCFRAHLLPDGAELPVLAILPSPRQAPDSSLSHMMEAAMAKLGAAGGGWFAGPDGAPQGGRLLEALHAAVAEGRPVLLAATAFTLVRWLDELDRGGVWLRLPEGSRLMETGGFKGRVRAVSREELYWRIRTRLGIPPERVVNEYGMTELLSQFYEPVLTRHAVAARPLAARFHVAPPWVRTRVLDPVSLEGMPEGRTGLLCHYDLANLGSVACVLTEDLGMAIEDGIRVQGRIAGAEPRGCSLATEELLDAQREA